LLRAQRAFVQVNDSGSDSDTNIGSDNDLGAEQIIEDVKGKGKEKVEWSIKPRKDIPKRTNKNA
jgi:ribosomal RNA-processing protein 36